MIHFGQDLPGQKSMFKAIIQIVLIGVFSFRDDFKKLGCFLNTGAVTLFQYFISD